MFGNLNKPAFGAAAPNTSFGFGASTASTPNPFGQNQLFGKPAAGGFGSTTTSTFGQPASTSLFSAGQQQQTNIFQNANTTFGTPVSTQSGFGSNLFGQPQASTSGLFGSTSTFGQQNKPATFGFGAAATPSLFGQQPQQPQGSNLFQSNTSNLFGGTSAFGGQQQTGTQLKFNPVTGSDTMMKNGVAQTINTKHHCITCMKEYEIKSLEELRWEDYQANRKGPQQSSFGTAPFGATASTAPSLFGQPEQKPAFGQATGFGQTTSTFGQAAPAFGMANQPSVSAGLFGKPTGFGSPSTSTASGFGFSAPQNANPFGATNAAKPFGSASQPIFGSATTQPAQSTFGTGLFGQTNTQNTTPSLFGKPAQPTTGFGAGTSTFGFGQTATTQASNLFQPKQPSLFGQTSTTGFGQPLSFGQTQSSGFGSFGKPAAPAFGQTTTTGFGSTLGGMQQQGSSLFGNAANKPGGLFGVQQSTGLFGNTNTTLQPTAGFGLQAQQPQQMMFPAQDQQSDYKNLALLTTDPFGDAPHLAGLEPKLRNDSAHQVATNPTELKSILDSSKKVECSPSNRLKVIPLKSKRDSLFEGIHKIEPEGSDQLKSSCRRLVLRHKPTESPNNSHNSDTVILNGTPLGNLTANLHNPDSLSNSVPIKLNVTPVRLNFENSINEDDLQNASLDVQTSIIANSTAKANVSANKTTSNSPPPSDDEDASSSPGPSGDSVKKHPTGIICTRPEYYTLPSLDELTQYIDENGSCFVKGFTIGRKGYGNVCFPDVIDVAGLNIDEMVHFRYREINVYPDENKKPPIGQGLNRKAQVTLDNIYPRKSGSNILIKDTNELLQMNFAEKLRKVTVKKGAKFVDYRPETGSWVFKVDHFSKYGFNDSDDESENNGKGGTQKNIDKNKIGVEKEAKEALAKLALQKKEKGVAEKGDMLSQVQPPKFGLDKDIFIEEEDQSVNEDDVLHQSMYVDMSEDDYPPPGEDMPVDHLASDLPTRMVYDPFKSSKSIQVMKSTLFGDDDRSSDGAGSHVSIIRQYLDIPEEIPPPTLPAIREEAVQKKKRAVLRPKVVKVYNFGATEKSTGIIPERCYMDLAIFKGKSFRVGWTTGFNFVQLNSAIGEINGQLALSTIEPPTKASQAHPLDDFLIDALKVVLEESVFDISDDNIPTFKISKNDGYLYKQTELFKKLFNKNNSTEAQYLYSIWTLCTALWGASEDTISNRRYLFSEWLKTNTNNIDDYSGKSDDPSNIPKIINAIFNCLSVFKIFEAANLAMENRLPNLAMIISQLSITNTAKALLQEQVDSWYDSLASNHIPEGLKKIYLLLAGVPSKEDVNVFENVDWKRALGMHLWFLCSNGSSIEEATEFYKRAFEDVGYAERPLPPYSKNFAESCSYDVLYHVLTLYKSNVHQLGPVLNPATHTDDPLDYRLSWLLLQFFLSMDIGLVEEFEKSKISTSFSNQLESLGFWEWSIYILLYLKDNSLKKNLIMGILDRNLSPKADEETMEIEDNLVTSMRVPPEWIHRVKAQKNLLQCRYFEAFNHFAHAEDWCQANDILVEHILPGLFINEQYDILKSLIKSIEQGSKEILKWNYEAGLVYDFIELQENDGINLRNLQAKLHSICERLGSFPLKNNEQKLCIAELSKRCASLYIELVKKSKVNFFKASYYQFIDSLVMPPDFKQAEALYLINEFENFTVSSQ